MKALINLIVLLIVLILIERLSYSIPKVYIYWFGLFSGICIYSAYDLFFNELKNHYDE